LLVFAGQLWPSNYSLSDMSGFSSWFYSVLQQSRMESHRLGRLHDGCNIFERYQAEVESSFHLLQLSFIIWKRTGAWYFTFGWGSSKDGKIPPYLPWFPKLKTKRAYSYFPTQTRTELQQRCWVLWYLTLWIRRSPPKYAPNIIWLIPFWHFKSHSWANRTENGHQKRSGRKVWNRNLQTN